MGVGGGGGGGSHGNMSPVVVRSLPGAIPTVAQQAQQPSQTALSPQLTGSNDGKGQGQGQNQDQEDDDADSEEGGGRGQGRGRDEAVHSWVHVALVLDSSPEEYDDDDDDDSMAAEGSQEQLDLAGGAEVVSLPLRVTLYVDHKQVYPPPHTQSHAQSRLYDADASSLLQLRKLPRYVKSLACLSKRRSVVCLTVELFMYHYPSAFRMPTN